MVRRILSIWGLAYLGLLVLISHLLLPRLNRQEVLPFSTWQLYSGARVTGFKDLRIHLDNKSVLLTEASTDIVASYKRHRLWYLLQTGNSSSSLLRYLQSYPTRGAYREIEVCEIECHLPLYILSKNRSESVRCHESP